MRVRIIAWPPLDEIDEFDIRRRFRIGQIYELPVQLAATFIILGYAEGLPREREREPERAVAADAPPRRRRRNDS